jgi:hypothetical protein
LLAWVDNRLSGVRPKGPKLIQTESPGGDPAGIKRVTQAEVEQVTELFTAAFYDDPTWSWAFPDPDERMDQYRAWWGLYVRPISATTCADLEE